MTALGLSKASPCPRAEIVEQGYDLSINRYKEIEYADVEHRPPLEIIAEKPGFVRVDHARTFPLRFAKRAAGHRSCIKYS